MGFKFSADKIDKTITITQLLEKRIIPSDLPEEVLMLRELVIDKVGYSRWEQEAWQRHLYNNAHGITNDEIKKEPVNKDIEKAIEIKDVTKIYQQVLKKKGEKPVKQRFVALENISFDVYKGDILGIFGTNGSGKTTLTQLIAGNNDYEPTGEIKINGKIELLPVRVALKENLTGEENIFYKGALMGMRKKEIKEMQEFVEEFSELGDKLYTPVKGYSAGMKSKLGFSLSLAVNPDIYIVDEALSVGDKAFQKKCFDYMSEITQKGQKTMLFVSHSIKQIQEFCTKAVWIEIGQLFEIGDVETVACHYKIYTNYLSELPRHEKEEYLRAREAYRSTDIPTFRDKLKKIVKRGKGYGSREAEQAEQEEK